MLKKEEIPFWEKEGKISLKEAEENGEKESAFAIWNWECIFAIPEQQVFTLNPENNALIIRKLEGQTTVTVGYARERALIHKEVYQMFLEYIRDTVILP